MATAQASVGDRVHVEIVTENPLTFEPAVAYVPARVVEVLADGYMVCTLTGDILWKVDFQYVRFGYS